MNTEVSRDSREAHLVAAHGERAPALAEFRDEAVPEAIVEEILAEGLLALPPGSTDEPHFVIVRTPKVRKQLSELIKKEVFHVKPLWRFLGKIIPAIQAVTGLKLMKCPLAAWTDAPVLLLVSRPAQLQEDPVDRGALVQRIVLAAQCAGLQALRLEGLATVVDASRAIRLMLGFPATVSVTDLVALGYPSQPASVACSRPSVRSSCTWV